MTDDQIAVITALRMSGYAVMAFYPEELRGADPRHVEDRLGEAGAELIALLGDEPVKTDSAGYTLGTVSDGGMDPRIEQAGRAAPQSQDLEDAQRYRWLRNRASAEGICVVHIDYWSEEYRGQAHCEVYDGEFLDKSIDHARRVEGSAAP